MFSRKRKLAIAAVFVTKVLEKRKKRSWSKKWLMRRDQCSDVLLLKELNEEHDFQNYLRMGPDIFSELLRLIGPLIKREETKMRSSITSEERLVATLRFLATGRSYECLKFSSRISAQSLGRIIPETCRVIYEVLREEYLKFPRNEQEWRNIALQFESRWNFPNCGGSIDGKHIRIARPAGTGAMYYNYKNFYSMILMAIVNADYEFIYVDVGKNGRNSDSSILESTSFFENLVKSKFNLPSPEENVDKMNFVFVGDEAFALHKHILKPYGSYELNYSKRIFNYRLSRARNVVENAFGIMTSRFRVLHTTINMKPDNIQYIVMATCVLHNFLRRNSRFYLNADSEDRRHEIQEDAEWRNDSAQFLELQASRGRQGLEAKENREKYLQYFNGKGAVQWQDEMLRKGKA